MADVNKEKAGGRNHWNPSTFSIIFAPKLGQMAAMILFYFTLSLEESGDMISSYYGG